MRVYADTSWWLAYKSRRDIHHLSAITLFDDVPDAEVVWTPWQRVEVFNVFRQAERAGLIEAGESTRMARLLEHEVRLGYWPHAEFSWTDTIRRACDFSAAHSLLMMVRGMDLFHIAIARQINVGAFISFDHDQIQLAQAVGLRIIPL